MYTRVDTAIDEDQSAKCTKFARCPNCGQKLADVEMANGEMVLRHMCRRCRQYVKISIKSV